MAFLGGTGGTGGGRDNEQPSSDKPLVPAEPSLVEEEDPCDRCKCDSPTLSLMTRSNVSRSVDVAATLTIQWTYKPPGQFVSACIAGQ